MATKKAETKKEQSKGIMDVSKPGQSAASSTSRPIIVGHKPVLQQDPMVSAAEVTETPPASDEAPKVKVTREKVLKPLNETKEAADAPVEDKVEKPKEEPEQTEAGSKVPEISSSAAVDALASEVSAKREAEQASEEDIKQQAHLEELVQSRKYFVPLGEVSRKRNIHILFLLLFMIFVLLPVGLNFVIDAELLDIGIEPLTNVL